MPVCVATWGCDAVRDVMLMVGFAVCVVVGAVTVLWPQLSSPDDAPRPVEKTAAATTK